MNTVEFEKIDKEYIAGQPVLKNLDVKFDEESINLIVGKSGAGKTTLIRILLGLTKPTRGRVLVNDVDISHLNRVETIRYRRHVGLISHDPTLIQNRTIFENVAMPLRVIGLNRKDTIYRVGNSLRIVGLDQYLNVYPEQLSSGEKQRVSIARAMVHRPKLLVADEPTGNLDRDLAIEVLNLFEYFPGLGTTVIVATHDWNLITQSHSVFELENGSVVARNVEGELLSP